MSPLPPITTIFMPNLLVCRPQVGAEFVTAVNLRHPCALAAERLAAQPRAALLKSFLPAPRWPALLVGCSGLLASPFATIIRRHGQARGDLTARRAACVAVLVRVPFFVDRFLATV